VHCCVTNLHDRTGYGGSPTECSQATRNSYDVLWEVELAEFAPTGGLHRYLGGLADCGGGYLNTYCIEYDFNFSFNVNLNVMKVRHFVRSED